jgi:DNA-3-methyladenine glycosylase I
MVKEDAKWSILGVMDDTTPDDDGLARCPWGMAPPEYRLYHDHEWGRPVGDDRPIYEKLCLEGFQSGLSWLTILRKREGFRRAFAGFEPEAVAAFDDQDVARLVTDVSIVRHRAKIEAAIANARAVVGLWAQGISLGGLLWAHEADDRGDARASAEVPSFTPASKAFSVELRRYGFRFVGPTTAYAAMQSLGVVNDHVADCHFRALAEQDRAKFKRPRLSAAPGAKSRGKRV